MTVKDYPDWTDAIQVIGTDIMLPIDIQGAYIMMPIDIQAQYIDLEVDIVAQTIGNINVDLVAQTVGDITVDINAQTIGDITIDIDAQHVGVYLQPDWNIKEGNGKAWNVVGANKARGAYVEQTYEVPANKTLYITWCSCSGYAYSDADGDLQQQIELYLTGVTMGGNGGCQLQLNAPVKYVAETTMTFRVYNRANHNITVQGSIKGYEI